MTGLIKFFTKNTLLVNIIVLFIFLAGGLNLTTLKREMYPSVELDRMSIYVVYPGASSTDVELNAVIPIEKELRKISGIREFTSYSNENGGKINLSLDYDLKNKQAVKDEVFRNITKTGVSGLSENVDTISIFDLNPKLMDIMTISLTTRDQAKYNEKGLNDFADRLEDLLLDVPGVSSIRKQGNRESEIHINVNPDLMDKYYVSLAEIEKSIRVRNIRITGGTLQSKTSEQKIIAVGQFDHPMDVKDVIIRSNFVGQHVRVRDVATVRESFKPAVYLTRTEGKKSVLLKIVKKENSDIVKTARNVQTFLETSPVILNSPYEVAVVDDKSNSITALLDSVLVNALIGFGLVIVILIFFLNLRTSFWIAFAIPVSLMVTLIVMKFSSISLNLVSVGAIITVLGMLVDDGIVTGEAIYTELSKGYEPVEAVVNGVKTIIAPVSVSIATTILAFIPMFSVKGMMGKVIFIFPVVITASLLASLSEAYFILPNHLLHSHNATGEKQWFKYVERFYEFILMGVLRLRYLVIILFVGVFLSSVYFSRETIKNFILIWDDSSDRIFINLEAVDGISLEGMDKLTKEVSEKVSHVIRVEEDMNIMTVVGSHSTRPGDDKGYHENWSQVVISLVPRTGRERSADDIIAELRGYVNRENFPHFTSILFEKLTMGPPAGEPVNVKIIDKDFKRAQSYQKKIEDHLRALPGIFDLDNDQKAGKEELTLSFNYENLARANLNVTTVAETVRTAYDGKIASSTETIDDTIDFRVQLDEKFKSDRTILYNLQVPNSLGKLIRLGDIAEIVKKPGRSTINHYNGDRVITITANINEKVTTSSLVAESIRKKFSRIQEESPETKITMGGEARETEESLAEVKSAFILAIVMIYFLLTILFKSFMQPLIVMITIPFGVTGALGAFTVHGIPLTFMGLVGIIGLSGVVVNDNIVMLNFLNRELVLESDWHLKQGIASGAKQRLRPVILTTLTTVLGLLPTVYGIGGTSTVIIPTVMAMAYGLLFASLLTLFFIPSLYYIHHDFKRLGEKIVEKISG